MPLVQIDVQRTKSNARAWWRSPRVIRHGVMLFFFLFLLRIAWHHNVKGGGPNGEPSVEAFCPFGGLESLYQFATTGGFIRRIEPSALILFAAVILLTLLFSRGFCGWICPFGSVQEWLGLLGRKIFKKRYNPSGAWDRRLRLLKYVLLVLIIGFTWHLGTLVFRPYDPFLAFFHLGQGFDEMPWAYAALGVVILGSLYIERFFCKYACPLGAVIGIIGKLGLSKVVRDETDCKGCNLCQKKCFAHVDFLSTRVIKDAECNHCMDCVVHCPKPNVLSLKGVGWNISHRAYAALLVAGLFGMVGASKLAGYWVTKPGSVSFTDASGRLDPEQIRGWMTLAEISKGYGIPAPELYRAAGLPAEVKPETRLNQVARHYRIDFEPDSVRDVVRSFLVQSQAKPQAAASSTPQASGGETQPKPKPSAPKQSAKPAEKKDHPGGEQEVKGFMTLNEVAMKTGVPKEFILRKMGVEAKVDPRIPLREWMHSQGKSIQDVRDAVAAWRAARSSPRQSAK
jgi:polyferredoxin